MVAAMPIVNDNDTSMAAFFVPEKHDQAELEVNENIEVPSIKSQKHKHEHKDADAFI